MITQTLQSVDYINSMPTDIVISGKKDYESTRGIFHNVILGILMILMPFMISTFLNSVNVQSEYNMQRIRAEVMTLEKQNVVMKLEVTKLSAPVRIQKIAETKLGMNLPVRNIYGSSDVSQLSEHGRR
ncbi:cell division protein FtsL [Dialister sp.]|jgi:cell division protein FtsL|uniref:cell division protein FtsL n=1 Tax=Dialister sp. TaxID=1955814 RepID=UPI002E80C74B|nr:cell division protein FtsL [Dialister sp.]MEE3452098.1 cell division protein FtsL [Dialister sp.]